MNFVTIITSQNYFNRLRCDEVIITRKNVTFFHGQRCSKRHSLWQLSLTLGIMFIILQLHSLLWICSIKRTFTSWIICMVCTTNLTHCTRGLCDLNIFFYQRLERFKNVFRKHCVSGFIFRFSCCRFFFVWKWFILLHSGTFFKFIIPVTAGSETCVRFDKNNLL